MIALSPNSDFPRPSENVCVNAACYRAHLCVHIASVSLQMSRVFAVTSNANGRMNFRSFLCCKLVMRGQVRPLAPFATPTFLCALAVYLVFEFTSPSRMDDFKLLSTVTVGLRVLSSARGRVRVFSLVCVYVDACESGCTYTMV